MHIRRVGGARIVTTALLTLTGPALSLCGRSSLANLGALSPALLTLSSLPSAHLFEAFRVLAVPLIPVPRLVGPTAALPQADSRSQLAATGRRPRRRVILESSQGRCLLPVGPPERLAKVPRALFLSGRLHRTARVLTLPPRILKRHCPDQKSNSTLAPRPKKTEKDTKQIYLLDQRRQK